MENGINFEPFRWKIENISKQNTKNLQSKAFRIRGYKWYLQMKEDLNSQCYRKVKDMNLFLGWTLFCWRWLWWSKIFLR